MASSIAELLAEQGRVLAGARYHQGERRAALVGGLSQLPGQIMADQQAARAARAEEARRIAEGIRQQRTDARLDQTAELEAARFDAEQDDRRKRTLASEAQKVAARAYVGVPEWIQDATRRGLLTQEEGANLFQQAQQPEGAKRIVDFIAPLADPKAQPALIQRDPTRDLVHPLTGEVVTPGTPEAPNLTFGAPHPVMIGGKRVLVRPASDGGLYDIRGNKVAEAEEAPDLSEIETARHNRAMEARATQTSSDPGPLETIIGPDGKPIRVQRKDAIGKPPASGTEKASSGVQKRVLNFFNRAQQADVDLESMEAQIQDLSLAGQGRLAVAPNVLQSELGQQYLAAQRAFTEARLRKDSGAAIPPHEFASDRKTYFAQPGDSKTTLEQKRRARAAMLASLAFESGQALGEYVGDADEARRIVEGYKARAKKGDAAPPPDTNKKRKVGRFEVEVED